MPITVHDEGGFEAAQRFLDAWIPPAASWLGDLLGVAPALENIAVLLSDSATHNQRFPAESVDVSALYGPMDEVPPHGADQVSATMYAHGVTTTSTPEPRPAAVFADDTTKIFLDVPTIERLADEHGVAREAMLARVVVHELSHALRHHATAARTAVHGYVAEGDAQRDTWHVLTALLADPAWRVVASAARVAQVRLAAGQPPAYGRFGSGSPDTGRGSQHDPTPPRTWLLSPPRGVLPLSRLRVVEVPVRTAARFLRPDIGDLCYLVEDRVAVGPWIVLAWSLEPEIGHPKDLQEIDREIEQPGGRRPPLEWMHLRPAAVLQASADLPDKLRVHPKMIGRELSADDARLLDGCVSEPAGGVLQRVADELLLAHRATVEEFAKRFTAAGQPVPGELLATYDPYA